MTRYIYRGFPYYKSGRREQFQHTLPLTYRGFRLDTQTPVPMTGCSVKITYRGFPLLAAA